MDESGTEENRPSKTEGEQGEENTVGAKDVTLGGNHGGSGQGGSTSGGLSDQDGPTSEDEGGAMGPGGRT